MSRGLRAAGAVAAALITTISLSACAGLAAAPGSTNEPAAAMRGDSSHYIVLAVDNPLDSPAGRAGSSLGAYPAAPRYVLGQRAAGTLAAIAREHGLREAAGWPIATLGWHCVVFELPPGQERAELLASLGRDARVRLAQPLQDFETLAAAPSSITPPADGGLTYNDPYVNLQRGFVDTGAARAHRLGVGAGVRIAVVDTGAATGHPDLAGRVAATRDLVGEADGRFEADRHGTEVAGIIAAAGNNHEGIVGIAPQARLELFKACWQRADSGGAAGCNSFTLAKALGAVLESDARIVNLSLGGPADPLLDQLLALLLQQGRIVIGALPADGRRGGFPTGTPGVIAAGVAGAAQTAAGADVVSAPGRDVLTLQPGGAYDYASGSSIAAAHVSGVAALLLGIDPKLDRASLRTLLTPGDTRTLDAGAALDALTRRVTAAR